MNGKVQQMLSQNKTISEDLTTIYQGPLSRYFLRQGLSSADASDCVQEVFARVVSKGDLQGLDNPQGYIFRIANNLLKDRYRRDQSTQRDKHDTAIEASLFCERPLQERVLAGQQELTLVKQVIMKMPKSTRSVFILNRFERLKYREVANVLGISVSAVEKHMMLALKRLNKLRASL